MPTVTSQYIDYAVITPTVLSMLIRNTEPNAFCSWEKVDSDSFEFSVKQFDSMPVNAERVQRVISTYL